MDIQHIKYFLAVADHQSFSKAAESLFVTQPILTRCVKNLEEELGAPLIIRNSKLFQLTDVGRVLYEHGRILVEDHRDLFRKIEDVKRSSNGVVHIASPGVLLDMYFPMLVTQFRKINPNISINILEMGSKPSAQAVLDGEVDIGLVMLPVDGIHNLNVYPIVENEVRVLVRADHPHAAKDKVHITELSEDSIITYNNSTTLHDTFMNMCREHGFTPSVAYQSMMATFILETISYGSCVGVLPGPLFYQFPTEGLTSVSLEPKFPWVIAMVTKKGRYFPYAANSFLEFSIEYFKNLSHK